MARLVSKGSPFFVIEGDSISKKRKGQCKEEKIWMRVGGGFERVRSAWKGEAVCFTFTTTPHFSFDRFR
jgi:hypothetical protein